MSKMGAVSFREIKENGIQGWDKYCHLVVAFQILYSRFVHRACGYAWSYDFHGNINFFCHVLDFRIEKLELGFCTGLHSL